MPPAARKASVAATADEAQTEAKTADKVPDLGAFRRAFEVMKEEVYTRVDSQVSSLREEIENLSALAASGASADPDVLNGIKGQLAALTDGRVTRNELTDLASTVDRLAETVDSLGMTVASNEVGSVMAVAPGVPQVYGKVLELMRRVTEIGKEREADLGRGGRYNFRGIDQAMDAVGSAMRSVGLILSSEVVNSEHIIDHVPKYYNGKQDGTTAWSTTRVTMRYTFIAPADGSKHVVEGYGVGRDNADKDGSKAMSAAMKYALFQGLCIPVQGMNFDSEEDHPVIEQPPQQPASVPPPEQPDPPRRAERPAEPPKRWERQPGESEEDYKARRAEDALAAAYGRGIDFAKLNEIVKQAKENGLLEMVVSTGRPLSAELMAISHTLAGPPEPPEHEHG